MAISQYDFNDVLPAAPDGTKLCGFQKVDNVDTEIRSISMYMEFATLLSQGLVKPDGTSITIDDDGTIHAAVGSGAGGHTEPLCFNGEVLFFRGDVLMIGVDY